MQSNIVPTNAEQLTHCRGQIGCEMCTSLRPKRGSSLAVFRFGHAATNIIQYSLRHNYSYKAEKKPRRLACNKRCWLYGWVPTCHDMLTLTWRPHKFARSRSLLGHRSALTSPSRMQNIGTCRQRVVGCACVFCHNPL